MKGTRVKKVDANMKRLSHLNGVENDPCQLWSLLIDEIHWEVRLLISTLWALDMLADGGGDLTIDDDEAWERFHNLISMAKDHAEDIGDSIMMQAGSIRGMTLKGGPRIPQGESGRVRLWEHLADKVYMNMKETMSMIWAADQLAEDHSDAIISAPEARDRVRRLISLARDAAEDLDSATMARYAEISSSDFAGDTAAA